MLSALVKEIVVQQTHEICESKIHDNSIPLVNSTVQNSPSWNQPQGGIDKIVLSSYRLLRKIT